MKIGFIGGGNMGEAILSALLDKGLSTPRDISVSDISRERRSHLEQKYRVTVTDDNRQAVSGPKVVVLALKPQHLSPVLAELKGKLKGNQLALSIIAGTTLQTLSSGLAHNSIVRVMPNTPAQIGRGMSVWTATPEVTGQQRELAGSILGAIGREIYVADEKYLDMATAVSGSGPAYFFLFVEALVEGAVKIGLPPETAKELVLQTMLGSGHLIQESDLTPAELRRMVTSPGGTTAEALKELDEGGFNDLVARAVKAAYDKARSLGEGK